MPKQTHGVVSKDIVGQYQIVAEAFKNRLTGIAGAMCNRHKKEVMYMMQEKTADTALAKEGKYIGKGVGFTRIRRIT